MKHTGFTLIETVIAICLIAVIAGFFAFQFNGMVGRIKLQTTSRQIVSDLRSAQARAMSEKKDTEVNFFRGYYLSDGKLKKFPSGVVVLNPHGVKFSASGAPVVGAFAAVELECNQKPCSIIISPEGRIRIE